MKNRKRIISAALVAALLGTSIMSGTVLAAKKTDSGLTYKVSGKNATITGYKGTSTKVKIPKKIGKYTVTKIGKNAFLGNTKIKSVSVPKTVTAIEYGAFGGADKLTKVTVASDSKLKSIGTWAFGRSGIKSFVMPDSVNKIGTYLFSECNQLEMATLSPGLKSIPKQTFYWDPMLYSINIPESVTSIGTYAFASCSQLNTVNGGKNVKTLGDYAFAWDYSLTNVSFDNVKTVGKDAFDGAGISTLKFTNKSLTIKDEAYLGASVTSVTFPKSVTSIQYGAFNNCYSLTEIKLPTKVGSISGGIFTNTSWADEQKDPVYVGDNLLMAKTGVSSVAVKSGTKKICEFAFEGETTLGSVTIPDGVKTIGEGAFFDTGLTSVTIPASVTEIGNLALGYKKYEYKVQWYDFENYDDYWTRYEEAKAKEKKENSVIEYNNWNSESTDIITKYCYGDCVRIPNFTIYGKEGSAAEAYAKTFGFNFVAK